MVVRQTSSVSEIISRTADAITRIWTYWNRRLPTETVLKSSPPRRLKVSYARGEDPQSRTAVCWRKNDTPRALIKGAMRGARRSGRYAKRSITSPSSAQPTIAAMNIRTITTGVGRFGLSGPPSAWNTKNPM